MPEQLDQEISSNPNSQAFIHALHDALICLQFQQEMYPHRPLRVSTRYNVSGNEPDKAFSTTLSPTDYKAMKAVIDGAVNYEGETEKGSEKAGRLIDWYEVIFERVAEESPIAPTILEGRKLEEHREGTWGMFIGNFEDLILSSEVVSESITSMSGFDSSSKSVSKNAMSSCGKGHEKSSRRTEFDFVRRGKDCNRCAVETKGLVNVGRRRRLTY